MYLQPHPNILLLGTSHLARGSAQEIEHMFSQYQPDVIALELDSHRLSALLHPQRRTSYWALLRKAGIAGFLFALLGRFLSRRIGKVLNTEPGIDMLTGFWLAKKNKKRILLVDQDISVTLRAISGIPFRKKCRMLWVTIKGFFSAQNQSMPSLHTADLSAAPSPAFVAQALHLIQEWYPELYAILIEQRNQHIAKALLTYHRQHPEHRILVILGAGHLVGVEQLLHIALQPRS
ncbi:MAG: TraB/GumN family protein [Candidatus Woesearchaeota archaeon]